MAINGTGQNGQNGQSGVEGVDTSIVSDLSKANHSLENRTALVKSIIGLLTEEYYKENPPTNLIRFPESGIKASSDLMQNKFNKKREVA